MIGYGTAYFQDGIRRPELICYALRTALRLGYRHVDSAAPWSNERGFEKGSWSWERGTANMIL